MPGPSLLRHPTSKNCPQMTPLASSLPLWPRIPISPLLTPSQLSAPLCLSWHQAVVKIQRQAWKFPQIVLSCSPHWPHLCSGITVPCPRPTRHLLRTLVKSGGGQSPKCEKFSFNERILHFATKRSTLLSALCFANNFYCEWTTCKSEDIINFSAHVAFDGGTWPVLQLPDTSPCTFSVTQSALSPAPEFFLNACLCPSTAEGPCDPSLPFVPRTPSKLIITTFKTYYSVFSPASSPTAPLLPHTPAQQLPCPSPNMLQVFTILYSLSLHAHLW